MPVLTELIGETVVNRAGDVASVSGFVTDSKVLGLYFSSSWCHERIFTPFLASFYSQFRAMDKEDRLEIVYISADKDESSFSSYLDEMPWHAVPFTDYQRRSKLWKKYRVRTTPTLVFIEGLTGKLITDKGRDCLSDDIEGRNFPWKTKSLNSILQGGLIKNGEAVDVLSAMDGKVKGFYFAAHWCPPCRTFTQQLVQVYEKVISNGHKFEVIFISSDRSETSFNEYYRSMPSTWLTLPYNDQRILQLTRHFQVQGIPTLVLVDESNRVISANARFLISDDIDGNDFPWRRKVVEPLSENNCLTMYEDAALVYFTDGDAEQIEKAKQLLCDVALDYGKELTSCQDSLDQLPPLHFYYEGAESDEVADSIRSFAQLEGRQPTVAIMDPFDQHVYSLPQSVQNITRSDVDELITEFKNSMIQFDKFNSSVDS